jgi:hypothetical protein
VEEVFLDLAIWNLVREDDVRVDARVLLADPHEIIEAELDVRQKEDLPGMLGEFVSEQLVEAARVAL